MKPSTTFLIRSCKRVLNQVVYLFSASLSINTLFGFEDLSSTLPFYMHRTDDGAK